MTDLTDVEAVTFDSYSTLVDVGTTVPALADHVEDPVSIARTWRIRSLIYTLVSNDLDTYEPFEGLCTEALAYALADAGVELPADTREDLMAVYHDLDGFADVRPGIERLVSAEYDCYVVSNGDPGMLASMLRSANITDLITDTISADHVERYKPAAAIYEAAVDRVGLNPAQIAHASAGFFDVYGAMQVGIRGVWLNRHDRPSDPFGPDPELVVSSVQDLADALGVP